MQTIQNPIIGDKTTFIKTNQESLGEKTVLEIILAPRGGNAMHFHKHFTETFTVIEGELKYQLGKKIFTLNPGQSSTIPINAPHRFFSTSNQPTKFICELNPGSDGFENALHIAYGLANDKKCNNKAVPKNFYHLALVFEMSQSYLVGIFSLITPILKIAAKRARKKGIEKELLGKYCIK
ncbi:MAG TPA: cupin domain-containing protein [Flavisolibacter sp.]|nr:cupin domain-containing protein [Flavisolibacter sp.]